MLRQRQLSRGEFGHWLRTGWVPATIEYKFNGWHDPDDGKFAAVGAGRYFPPGSSSSARPEHVAMASRPRKAQRQGGGFTGEGSGSFGGGGATGPGWERPEDRRARERQPRRNGGPLAPGQLEPRAVQVEATTRRNAQTKYTVRQGDTVSSIAERERMTVQQLAAANSLSDPNKIQTGQELTIPAKSESRSGWVSVRAESFAFELDPLGRTGMAEGALGTSKTDRSRRMQGEAGKPDRRPRDDGGHFIAPRFGGPKAAYNHFAQEANFNRGAYRALEDSWAKAQKEGEDVRVRIDGRYAVGSRRPDELCVEWTIAGTTRRRKFKNEAGGGRE